MSDLLSDIEDKIQNGLIRKQTDGNDLWIYNYTEECQFSKNWDDVTRMCRGLVLNTRGEIVARPFDKFFNLDETGETIEEVTLKRGEPKIFDKLDGSLGILFWYYERWNLVTRGSFTSDQAIEGKKILDEAYIVGIDWAGNQPKKSSTHMFEIIYPENRIVINYDGVRKLVYLGSRKTQTGEHFYDPELMAMFELPLQYFMMIPNEENKEGYVLIFPDWYRVKIKHDEYVRLHRIMTGFSPRRIWECLKSGDRIDTNGCPEEFVKQVEETILDLTDNFTRVKDRIEEVFSSTDPNLSRKEKAIIWVKHPEKISGMLFKKLDNKNYDELVWDKIKPEA